MKNEMPQFMGYIEDPPGGARPRGVEDDDVAGPPTGEGVDLVSVTEVPNQDGAVQLGDSADVQDRTKAEAPCLPGLISSAFDCVGITSPNRWNVVPGDPDHRRQLAENKVDKRAMGACPLLDPLRGRHATSKTALFLEPRVIERLKEERGLNPQGPG